MLDCFRCPTDTGIFPSLERVKGSKSLQGKFDAFKFSDDEIVRFQVNVHFCLQECSSNFCYESVVPDSSENNKSFSRFKRSIESKESQPLLPDYPLQREIIVEGLSTQASSPISDILSKGLH
jgi:hypothetical protein